ncbi:hypothetical protein P3T39_002942 [Kitasatospora sp. GP82]|nr:hypothetical protein [Kitasatospora sp. GP82]
MYRNGVHSGEKVGSGRLEAHSGTASKGPSPIDFAAEFAKLRAASTAPASAAPPPVSRSRPKAAEAAAGSPSPAAARRRAGRKVRHSTEQAKCTMSDRKRSGRVHFLYSRMADFLAVMGCWATHIRPFDGGGTARPAR